MAEENVNLNLRGKDITGKATASARKGLISLKTATVGVTIAAVALVAITKSVISAAKIQQDAERKLAATLKSTAEGAGLSFQELTKMASALQEVTTFGDEAIIEAQSLLLTFTKIGKETFPDALTAILNVSAAMGTDLKGSALQLGKALNDPILGISALSRTGITFSEVQKEQIRNFAEGGEVAKAQGIILKELETQFGGQAEATAKGLGIITQMSNVFGDLSEAIGFVIGKSSAFLGTIRFITASLSDLISALSEAREEIEGLTEKENELVQVEKELAERGITLKNTLLGQIKATKETAQAELELSIDRKIATAEAKGEAVAIFELVVALNEEGEVVDADTEKLIKRRAELQKLTKQEKENTEKKKKQVALTKKQLKEIAKAEEKAVQESFAQGEAQFAKEKALEAKDEAVKTQLKAERAERELAQDKVRDELKLESITNQFALERELLTQDFEERFQAAGLNEQLQTDLMDAFSQRRKDIARREAEFIKQQEKIKAQAVITGVASILGATSGLISALKGNAKVAKGLAIGEAVISGALAVQKALSNPPGPPFTIPLAIGIGVKAAANVATIVGQSFQTPAETLRTVPGSPTEERLIRAHGQEQIGRANQGFNITNNISGLITDADAVGRAIFENLKPFMRRNGVSLA